ncbi:DUF305 domain-containing protein [Actinomadura kijaniata]|uniref:DUF305 domain-containing protein n=1 Tax=Actinomadura kijaniata TaxID=46161 RepID=UPI000ADEC085|nr:DUF305 domain-containing protein [Actinomadura kijaniata]
MSDPQGRGAARTDPRAQRAERERSDQGDEGRLCPLGVPEASGKHGVRRRANVIVAVAVLVAAAVFAGMAALRSGGPAADGPEAGFARDMSAHHAQAVRMAFTVRDKTRDPGLRTLAYDIATTQQAQIGMMTAWLDEWGLPKTDPAGPMRWMRGHSGHPAAPAAAPAAMPGMATREQLDGLERASGRDAEIRFLRLMVVHHRAGVDMARAVLDRTGHERVRRLARSMVDGQRSEIDLMTAMLRERGVNDA